ncbi:MAG: beta-propeller domain-containing protein [Pirellulales bacterium]
MNRRHSHPLRAKRGRKHSGYRRLRLEHLEVRHALDGASLAPDSFDVHQNGPQIEFDVLANDLFDADYTGERLITSASYGSEGGRIQIASDRQSILYTPPADFFGTETFVYAVDGQYTAQVQVGVVAPLAFDHFNIAPDGQQRTLEVLANDPFWTGYAGPQRITAVSVGSAGGTVVIGSDGQSILYTPPEETFGKETFIYIVDDLYPAQVTIEIPATLEDDRYESIQHAGELTLDVLANDPFWSGYAGERRITHVAGVPDGGSVQIANDGQSLVYTPAENAVGWTSFRYVVDGTYEANVSVIVHRPVQDDWFEVDQNSTQFFYNVTANDTYRDLNDYVRDVIDRVTSVTPSESGGTVTISPGGKGILYTPPAGFTGTDTFTYTADGVHTATVQVQVTLPVRDDYITSGIYQDTPNGVLHVLANDFVGNGYSGPRLITAVGTSENGAVLTISADGKAVRYTPAPGFTGQDRFTYTVDGDLVAEVTVYVQPLAQPDNYKFAPDPAHGHYTLDVLGNDNFQFGYPGPGIITSVSVVAGSGSVSIQDGQRLLFEPGHAGSHSVRYTVDGQYEAYVSVWIANHLAPDRIVVDQNAEAQTVSVMANDFHPDPYYVEFKSQDYQGPRLITAVGASQHGGVITIAADGRSVEYQPPSDFFGQDHFTYTVDGFMTTTVTVEVIRRVRDDEFRVDAEDGQQSLPVLVNDLFGANYSGPGQITGVTPTSAGGAATIAPDGRTILYTPANGFVGADTFTYTVDGALKAEVRVVVDAPHDEQSPTFESLEEYTQFLIDDALLRYGNLFGQTAWNGWFNDVVTYSTTGGTRGHSETNVQVAGVDEGDIVEFDADYIYMLTDDEVVIVDAWPADELSVESRIDIEGRPMAEFLHGDRLTVISQVGGYVGPFWFGGGPTDFVGDRFWWPPIPQQPYSTIVTVIDVTDRAAPEIVQTTSIEGKYVDSRGVDDFVYVLVNNSNAVGQEPQIIDEDGDPQTPGRYETSEEYLARIAANPGEFVEGALPNYSSYGPAGELVRTGLLNEPEDIYRPLVSDARNLISVVSFNVEADDPGVTDTSAVYTTGASAIYASLDNFYVFDRDYSREDGPLTRIMKFDWEPTTGGVEFAATTTVVGTILNQFSADEHGDYLRIATTVSNSQSGNWSGRAENTLFVLVEDDGVFEFVGSLQNLALDETMQSVRFMGDRAFVSTFREIDPLFAIDLSDPADPQSVGHITLPGFTSYMQFIDANHLLTVGRNTPMGMSGPTQVSLFDISDLAQPRRIAEYTFERFSTSEAEIDHHAFGYYAEHGLLGMPVGRIYYERIDTDGDGYRETRRAVKENLLVVFNVDATASEPDERLALVSEIQHATPVRRSGYIGDKLYSISGDGVKVVDVSAPDVLIAELIVETSDTVLQPYEIYFTPFLTAELGVPRVGNAPPAFGFPAARTDGSFVAAVEQARSYLADQLAIEAGAPMLVTAEAAPAAPGGGYYFVFRVGDEQYLCRASDAGHVVLVQSDYEFADGASGPWHAVAVAVAPQPAGIPGDYNHDGSVNEQDRAVWRGSFGTVSLIAFHPADGNRDGVVDTADYSVWQDNVGAMAGDFNGDGAVDGADYAAWNSGFGGTASGGTRFDAAAYTMWRDHLGAGAEATSAAAALTLDEPQGVGDSDRPVAARAAAFADLYFNEVPSRGNQTSRPTRRPEVVQSAVQRSRMADLLAYQRAADAMFTAMAEDDLHAPLQRRPESREHVESDKSAGFASLDQPLADLARGRRLVGS